VNKSSRRKQSGFTLLEAIVSLVLIASTGMALFSWVNSNIITLNRVQTSNAENAATLNAIEYMHSINPMTTPQGQANLGSSRLSWQAEATTDPLDGASYPFGISLYQLAMYLTKITVQKSDGQFWFAFSLQQVGYKKVRDISQPF
jgi:general secretion pathway protein I